MRPAQMDSLGSISEDPPVDLHRAGVYLPTVRMAPVPPLLLLKMATCQTRPRCGNRLNLSFHNGHGHRHAQAHAHVSMM